MLVESIRTKLESARTQTVPIALINESDRFSPRFETAASIGPDDLYVVDGVLDCAGEHPILLRAVGRELERINGGGRLTAARANSSVRSVRCKVIADLTDEEARNIAVYLNSRHGVRLSDPEQLEDLRCRIADGLDYADKPALAEFYGVSRQSIYQRLKKLGIDTSRKATNSKVDPKDPASESPGSKNCKPLTVSGCGPATDTVNEETPAATNSGGNAGDPRGSAATTSSVPEDKGAGSGSSNCPSAAGRDGVKAGTVTGTVSPRRAAVSLDAALLMVEKLTDADLRKVAADIEDAFERVETLQARCLQEAEVAA